MITRKLNKLAVFISLVVGIALGIYMMEAANNYATWTTTLIVIGIGAVFIGMMALLANIVIVMVGTLIDRMLQGEKVIRYNLEIE
ncbi:MAG: hypothetical protein QXW39_07180 [Candidatus Bathyarchaeia archaeon]